MPTTLAIIVALIVLIPSVIVLVTGIARMNKVADAPQEDGRTAQERSDVAAMNKGVCPDCGAHGSLCSGPSGGMSQNVACDQCHMEFNVHFGFGTGAFQVDRTGKLSAGRARSAFGIDIGHPE